MVVLAAARLTRRPGVPARRTLLLKHTPRFSSTPRYPIGPRIAGRRAHALLRSAGAARADPPNPSNGDFGGSGPERNKGINGRVFPKRTSARKWCFFRVFWSKIQCQTTAEPLLQWATESLHLAAPSSQEYRGAKPEAPVSVPALVHGSGALSAGAVQPATASCDLTCTCPQPRARRSGCPWREPRRPKSERGRVPHTFGMRPTARGDPPCSWDAAH